MVVDESLCVVISSAGMGEGEPDLGEKLMGAFLEQLAQKGTAPHRMIFLNAGVFLTTEGSGVLDLLRRFEQEGSQIFSCGTCLSYHQRTDKLQIGEVGNMAQTVDAMLSYPRLLKL